MVTEELSKIPDIQKRLRVEKIASVAEEYQLIDLEIISRMHELISKGGDAMDSLHVASAKRAGAVFLTTDDDLVTFYKSHQLIQIRIENPVIWLKEENR